MVSSCEMELYLDMIKHGQPAFHKYQRKMERMLMLSKYAHVNVYTLSNKTFLLCVLYIYDVFAYSWSKDLNGI